MFEHWRQLAYYDNEIVFPSEELLDSLHLHEMASRKHVTKALQDLSQDFNELLLERGIYDFFYANCYKKVFVNKDSVLFV